jgi:hypothetical protein
MMSEEVRMVRKTQVMRNLMSTGAVARIERELETERDCELSALKIIYKIWRPLFKYSALASNRCKNIESAENGSTV